MSRTYDYVSKGPYQINRVGPLDDSNHQSFVLESRIPMATGSIQSPIDELQSNISCLNGTQQKQSVREIVYDYFLDNWSEKTPVTFDNESYRPNPKEPWVRLVVRGITSEQDSFGSPGCRVFTRSLSAVAQVFTPKNTGTCESDILQDCVVDIFEGVTIGSLGLRFLSPVATQIGSDGEFYMATVEAPFEYDEFK